MVARSLVELLQGFDIKAAELTWTSYSRLKQELVNNKPDVLLVDPMIKSLDPIQFISEVESAVDTSVSMMAVDGSSERLDEAVVAGASGFISLDTSVEDFINSLKLLSQGNVVATTPAETTLADIAVQSPSLESSRSKLSAREMEITELVASGLTNRELADRFELTEGTVKVHMRNIFRKLQISNRAELASFAHMSGIALG